jgi:hypothetical protein
VVINDPKYAEQWGSFAGSFIIREGNIKKGKTKTLVEEKKKRRNPF